MVLVVITLLVPCGIHVLNDRDYFGVKTPWKTVVWEQLFLATPSSPSVPTRSPNISPAMHQQPGSPAFHLL